MLIRTDRRGYDHPLSSEITPQPVYQQRRDWLRLLASARAFAAAPGSSSAVALNGRGSPASGCASSAARSTSGPSTRKPTLSVTW